MRELTIYSMEYYVDRAGSVSTCLKIADNLLANQIHLYGDIYLESPAKNIFDTVFITSQEISREYLLAMDYLSALLTAYRETNEHMYYKKFFDIIEQYFDYVERGLFSPGKKSDLIVYAQVLMFIKSFSIIKYEEPLKRRIINLLYEYAAYCYDDQNHGNDNHGLFTDLALLHLSVLFQSLPEAGTWKAHAVERVQKLFDSAFYEDGFNNEGSLPYFRLNLINYQKVAKFCEAYQIPGLESLCEKLETAKQAFYSLAHSDGRYPMIGDGREIAAAEHNTVSKLYPNAGICVVKMKEIYLTFKCGGTMHAHTHVDSTSITANFRGFDLVLDSGQYNYDRYHPINRYLRTSGGHSGIFPLFVDGLSLKEYLNRRDASKIDKFDYTFSTCTISGGYEMDGGAIRVRRDIKVEAERIEVRDSWICEKVQNMRQRFIIPNELCKISRFTASEKLFELKAGEYSVSYKIVSETTPITTTMNFGVVSKNYEKYEPTFLLDTIAENSVMGEITAIITVYKGDWKNQ